MSSRADARIRRWAAMLLALLVPLVGLTACEQPKPVVHHGEVRPAFDREPSRVSATGGRVERDGVRVDVPARTTATHVDVSIGDPLGSTVTGFGRERFGAPVRIDHDRPLRRAVTLTWPDDGLTDEQAARAFLVRWDEDADAWVPSDEPVRHRDGLLVAEVSRFSIVDWGTDLGQRLGELVGARAGRPTCSGDVPSWVQSTVASDGGLAAAAALMCFKSGDDGTVRVRVVNNRTFAERLTIGSGATSWRSAERTLDGLSVQGVAYSAFHTALDRDGAVLIPPGKEVVAELGRPEQDGSVFVSGTVRAQPVTVLADTVAYAMGQVSIGGTENPVLDALVQVVYECGGKQLSAESPKGAAQVAKAAVEALGDCTAEVARPDSEFGKRFEALSRKLVAKSDLAAKAAVQARRAAEHVSRAFAIITAGEVVAYLSDQFAAAVVGPLPWSIRALGTPPVLGRWSATCSGMVEDSTRLYRNLTLQDRFADTSREFWQFPGWAAAAAKAVRPLARCGADYRSRFAAFLPTDWATDARSVKVVADAVSKLASGGSQDSAALLEALQGLGMCADGCHETGHIAFQHPTWGASTLFTFLGASPSSGGFGVVDAQGEVRYVRGTEFMYELATHGLDKAGNLFMDYNPGRYNGVIVLRPTADGLEDFGSDPTSTNSGYSGRFYEAEVTDADRDGVYEIEQSSNSCDPSCAEGTISTETYRWTGSDYAVE